MIIERIYRDHDCIVIKIQNLNDHEFAFELQVIPNADFLISAIKAKVTEVTAPGHTPPEDPFAAKYDLLKQTLEGLDIGD